MLGHIGPLSGLYPYLGPLHLLGPLSGGPCLNPLSLAPSHPPGTHCTCYLLEGALDDSRRKRIRPILLLTVSPGPGTEPEMVLKKNLL